MGHVPVFGDGGGGAGVEPLRVRQFDAWTGNRRAVILHGYLEKPEDFLWTILVGNTLANLAAVGLLAVSLLHQWLGNWLALLTAGFLAVMFLFYAFCELLPKMLFRMYPNRLCLWRWRGCSGSFTWRCRRWWCS